MTISINEQEMAVKPQDNDNDIVLSVNGVSKKFCRDLKRSLMYGVQDIASELLGIREKSDKLRTKEFWALDNVSFQLRRGEALGLVGKNGSGKSTLLRIIAGLIKPDTGFVEVNGRVAPLIALGAGFNPILTGRENIYANMSILGLSQKEIDERFDEVVEFAEIGDAIDAPVQTYSSGMAARLGFASAIHTNPDILLIDEVLAVGDAKFRDKCARKLQQIRGQGTSFILVSHSSTSIMALCETSVYLLKGNLIKSGATASVLKRYEEDLFIIKTDNVDGKLILSEKPETESGGIDITSIYFKDKNEDHIDFPEVGEPINICVGCKVHKKEKEVVLGLVIKDFSRDGEIILVLSSLFDGKAATLDPGHTEMKVYLPYCGLRAGIYEMDIYIQRKPDYRFDTFESFRFKVNDSRGAIYSMKSNLFYQPRFWKFDDKNLT
ncbi:ABC transporter ATP-binding protein [Calothrix sp. NIES-2098]|uniref:ABC transporter ATP-binding protein n=1 Tax=Calothrix sp. NIES-2098 TaxID=1954171 RepID=UPI000B5EE7F7|nr:ABC transporter-related protein [Calothrix sp. NIES-2098]